MTLWVMVLSLSFLWKTDSLDSRTSGWLDTMAEPLSIALKAKTWAGMRPSVSVEVTDVRIVDDNSWAIMTIAGEALGEPLAGKIAVAEVIRNRMKRKYASDGTVIGTVLRAKQFSMWDDRARLLAARIDDSHPRVKECIEAWKQSETSNLTNGAVLYHTIQIQEPFWATAQSVKEVRTINNHRFYTDGEGA